LFLAVGLIAFLYSSVGHAGASGYIATMTLFGLAPTVIRPTALVLFFSAARLVFRRSDPPQTVPPLRPVAISTGAGLGFLSGLTGTAGGIFLTPLLRFFQWAHIRQAAAVSALFIWVNSIAGLVGYFTKVHSIPSLGLILAASAIIGGAVGSHLGSRRFAVRVISLLLATVLLIAGMKLLFTR
jgi:uncharacterized membrane protein YfcA